MTVRGEDQKKSEEQQVRLVSRHRTEVGEPAMDENSGLKKRKNVTENEKKTEHQRGWLGRGARAQVGGALGRLKKRTGAVTLLALGLRMERC